MKLAANDAHLSQLVRGAIGRDEILSKLPKLNVGSCGMVVTVHGSVPDEVIRARVRSVVESVGGVEGYVDRLSVEESCNSSESEA